MIEIKAILDRLDKRKILPSYQIEHRADIFFSLYLTEILEDVREIPIRGTIVPEYPVKQAESNRSDKVDYLAVTADGKDPLSAKFAESLAI